MPFAIGARLAEDVNEHLTGGVGWLWIVAILVCVALLFLWPRFFRRR
jgi:hypothetical protein